MAEESSRTTTRLVCISDTHDKYDLTLPDGEILLHAGDFTHNGTEQEIERFFLWLKSLDKYRLKIFIVGNHESKRFYTRKRYKTFAPIIERIKNDKNLRSNDGIVYLQDESFVDPIDGWKFYGSGWSPEHCKIRSETQKVWSKIPADIDILLTHNPPFSILDESSSKMNVGCRDLFDVVTNVVRPKIHLFGHVHGARGLFHDETLYGRTKFINASICDSFFRTKNLPIVIDLEKQNEKQKM